MQLAVFVIRIWRPSLHTTHSLENLDSRIPHILNAYVLGRAGGWESGSGGCAEMSAATRKGGGVWSSPITLFCVWLWTHCQATGTGLALGEQTGSASAWNYNPTTHTMLWNQSIPPQQWIVFVRVGTVLPLHGTVQRHRADRPTVAACCAGRSPIHREHGTRYPSHYTTWLHYHRTIYCMQWHGAVEISSRSFLTLGDSTINSLSLSQNRLIPDNCLRISCLIRLRFELYNTFWRNIHHAYYSSVHYQL